MTKRTVVIRKSSCQWQINKKRNTTPKVAPKKHTAGFISPVFIVLACGAFAGLFYIYSVNQTAIKGISIRSAEKRVADERKNNESLKIREAELKSLYHIEDISKQLNMTPTVGVKYLEENPSVAYSNSNKDGKK
ncbi:MAG: hypothetical protein WCI36_05580 [bacterium]